MHGEVCKFHPFNTSFTITQIYGSQDACSRIYKTNKEIQELIRDIKTIYLQPTPGGGNAAIFGAKIMRA